MIAALSRAGITDAFPIQAATIADALAGRDVLGKARTGSGKTLAFGLPTIARLADEGRATPNRPMAVILVPTRELAMQVNDSLEPYAHALGVSLRLVAGGLSMTKQIQALDRGVHLLVATPGRLADLARQGHADMSNVTITVLDEADHMAQMGFMDEITEIVSGTPRDGQRLLFSATLDGDVEALIDEWMHDPVLHDVTGGDEPPQMEHVALNIPPHIKYQLATRIANRGGRTIAFVRTKLAADRIADQMRAAGVLAVSLHGDKPQNERTAAITGFRAGQIPVLVATDVAARGIHVDHVDLVLQIDPPTDPKDYTHRAGRTARAGEAGLVVTLVLPHQRKQTDRMFDVAAIEPLFRKVRGEDAESLALVDKLTGGTDPSGIPVEAPRPPRSSREPYSRGKRDERPRKARSSVGRDGGHARRAQNDVRLEELTRKERDIIAREQALAEREAQFEAREESRETRSPAPRGGSQRGAAQRRNSQGAKSQGGKPQGGKSHGGARRDDSTRRDTGWDPKKPQGGQPRKNSGKPFTPGKSRAPKNRKPRHR